MTTRNTETIRAMFRARDNYVAAALAEETAWFKLTSAEADYAECPTEANARRLARARARHAAADAAYDAAYARNVGGQEGSAS